MANRETEVEKLLDELTKEHPELSAKEKWDQIYTTTNCVFDRETYADWSQLQPLIANHLPSSPSPESILVPACGNSRLSENLYDAGYTGITNVDISPVVITHMLKRNVRERLHMKWRAADMTNLEQFKDETFDAIIDKGGLDVLVDLNSEIRPATSYLFEVKRLLKVGGKYICVTFGEPQAFALLYYKFRFGWNMTLYGLRFEPSSDRPEAFMVVAEKLDSIVVSQITLLVVTRYSPERHGFEKAKEFFGALKDEIDLREEFVTQGYTSIYTPYEDLVLVAKANFPELEPGRRLLITIGDFGASRFLYDGILIDAPRDIGPLSHNFYVHVIPKIPTLKWLLQPTEAQWVTVKTRSAARVLMITLDTRHAALSNNDVLEDINPLLRPLAPSGGGEIVVKFASDGFEDRDIMHQVKSDLSGLIVVDDVISAVPRFPEQYLVRRLNIQTFMICEALFTVDRSASSPSESHGEGSGSDDQVLNFDHSYLASPHHNGIITGIMLIYGHFRTSVETLMRKLVIKNVQISEVKTVVIGLRAGVLSMFMKNCLPYLQIEVVEPDPVILDVSRQYFGFSEDEGLKVHIGDGAEFILEKADSVSARRVTSRIDILVIDVEVPYASSCDGFTAPAVEFLDDDFLLAVKKSLSLHGLFILNLIVWSSNAKATIYSRLKRAFNNIFHLPLSSTSDVNEVIFAMNSEDPITDNDLSEACKELARSLKNGRQEWGQRVIDASKLIKTLKE